MQQLFSLFAMLLNRWTASFAGIAVASMLVWYLGPLVPGLGSPLPRAVLILAAVIGWGAVNSVIGWRRRRREHALADGVVGGAPDRRDVKADAADEVARLRERMNASLARFSGNRRHGYLYEQPWFVLIGPPGSGKTTALLNSGLHFPLAQDDGSDAAIGGVGGTRLCDWWFTDEAVLIDTAGRYTTQDSDAEIDRAGWHGFLDMLRQARPRQPINGVLVVISLVDIATAPSAERTAHARSIRRRVKEISDRLRLRVPVYVVFSKADRLAGFHEYFDDLDAESRAQVWGMTLPLVKGVETFEPEFRLLLERIDARLFERLQAERAPDRRTLIAGFPLQVASLAQPLAEFLGQAFGGTRLDPAPFLRGIYMSSATQEGTPIDQLTGLLARSFGIDQKRAPSLHPVTGRSYFLRRLVGDVVLGEALLVSLKSATRRRRRWLRGGGFAAAGLAILAGALVLWRVESANQQQVTQVNAALAAYRAQLAGLTLDPVADDDLTRLLPVLDAAGALPRGNGFWLTGLPGLSQGEKLTQSDLLVYRNALQQILLPRLIWRLEAQMRDRFGDPDFLYEATRVYLMLGGAGPLDPALVRNWQRLDWQARFPGALNASTRDRLAHHLDALLTQPLPALTLDGSLVKAARATFSRVPLDQRVYGRIRADAASGTVADWAPAEALGPGGGPVFVRPSGKPLSEGIPGFYTADGFRTLLLGRLAATTREVADESWVLGETDEVPSQGPAETALEQAVVARYVTDFEARWDGLLGDLALAPFGDRDEAGRRIYVLSSPQSPIRDLLAAITQQLTLRLPAAGVKPAGAASAAELAGLISTPAAAQPGSAHPEPTLAAGEASTGPSAEMVVSGHYAGLRTLVDNGSAAAPLSGLLGLIDHLQTELGQTGSAPVGIDPVQQLLAEAQRQPVPVGGWLRQIAESGRMLLSGNAAEAATTAFAAADGPGTLCRQVVNGHYPFRRGAAQEAPLDDFSRLFAPGGLLDSFFLTQVKPYVDTSQAVWRPHPVGGVASPVDATTVIRFQRAASIRDAFFPTGGTVPMLRFTLAPLSEDTGTKAVMTVGGMTVAPAGQTALAWPATGGNTQVALAFDPASGSPPVMGQGSWALFRVMDQAEVTASGGSDSFTIAFRSGGQQARFSLQAGSSRNPFGHPLLEGFQCPTIR